MSLSLSSPRMSKQSFLKSNESAVFTRTPAEAESAKNRGLIAGGPESGFVLSWVLGFNTEHKNKCVLATAKLFHAMTKIWKAVDVLFKVSFGKTMRVECSENWHTWVSDSVEREKSFLRRVDHLIMQKAEPQIRGRPKLELSKTGSNEQTKCYLSSKGVFYLVSSCLRQRNFVVKHGRKTLKHFKNFSERLNRKLPRKKLVPWLLNVDSWLRSTD